MKYPQVYEGVWETPKHRGFKLACCDCGMVHIFDFRVSKGNIQFRVKVDHRATAAIRRPYKFSGDDE